MFVSFFKLIAIIVTGGHPEKLANNKIGSRKTDFVVYMSLVLVAAVGVVAYILLKKP